MHGSLSIVAPEIRCSIEQLMVQILKLKSMASSITIIICQIDISGNWKAIVIHVPYRLRKGFRKLHVRLVRELEKKFSGKLCFSEDSNSFAQDGFGFGSNSWDHRLGYLYFHYSDTSSPYARIPLMNKINELARSYPRIKSFKSIHLSPASWMAVAWYLMYHSPTGRNVKDLSTSFLTYHTLSSSFQDDVFEDGDKDICSLE